MTTLVLEFKKVVSDDETKYSTFYLSPKAETTINESDINNVFESIYNTITLNIQKYLVTVRGWVITSIVDHTINISKYKFLSGSSYIKLPKELDHPKKGLTNIHNINDEECFKWCLVRYLHPADNHPARIRKIDKDFAKKLNFNDINFHNIK